MLSQAVYYVLAICISFILVTAGPSNSTTSNRTQVDIDAYCYDVVDLYASPNASMTYTFPGVVQPLSDTTNKSTAPFTSSTIYNWQVKNLVGQIPDFYNAGDTYSAIQTYLVPVFNELVPIPPPPYLSTCAFQFGFPQTNGGKAPDSGNCSSLVGQDCVNDIQNQIQQSALGVAVSTSNMQLEQACQSISQSLAQLPKSCPKSGNSRSTTYYESKGLNLTLESNNTECPNGPEYLPVELFGNSGNLSYDDVVKRTTPVLLAFFSNGSLFTGTPFADTRLLCTSPSNITAGSRHPTSTAESSARANTRLLVGTALVMNALFFFAL